MPLIAVLMLAVPPLAFYGWFESRSRTIVNDRDLDPSFRNALKHASAASGLYTMLRSVEFSESMAEVSVVELGYLNEKAELIFKRGKRDTTAEMMKDLHNNMVGIGVARWMEGMEPGDARDRWGLLVSLGEKGLLKLSSRGIDPAANGHLSAEATSEVAVASDWFEARRDGIVRNVGQALAEIPRGESDSR